MAGALRKTMVYLGLAEEAEGFDEHGDYDSSPERGAVGRSAAPAAASDGDEQRSAVTSMKRDRSGPALVRERSGAAGEIARIATIHPRSYNDAKAIGEAYRDGVPVIMNLSDMGDADAKRLVDFSAGLVFGLRGSIERVTSKVFLLSPMNVEVTEEGGANVSNSPSSGFFNQS